MGKRSLNFFTAQLSSKNRHITVDGKTIVKLFYPRGRDAPASVGLKHDGLMRRGKLKVNAHLLWRRVYSLYLKNRRKEVENGRHKESARLLRYTSGACTTIQCCGVKGSEEA